MNREEFLSSKDTLKTQISIPESTKSIIVRFGDKYGQYKLDGVVEYSPDGQKWYILKEYQDLRRTSPYICLTVYPDIHKYIRFNLSLSGGKFRDVETTHLPCSQKSKEIKDEIKERKEKSKGFLEQIADVIKAYTTLLIVLLIIGIVAVVIFILFKMKVL